MKISELIDQHGAENVMLVVRLSDLQQFLSEIVESQIKVKEQEEAKQNDQDLLNPAEAGKILKVSRPTLERWKNSKYLVPVKIGGKCFYRKQDIDSLKRNWWAIFFKSSEDKFFSDS